MVPVSEILLPVSLPEQGIVWLVPDIEDDALDHIIFPHIREQLRVEGICFSPVSVIARVKRPVLATICTPNSTRDENVAGVELASGAICRKRGVEARPVSFEITACPASIAGLGTSTPCSAETDVCVEVVGDSCTCAGAVIGNAVQEAGAQLVGRAMS